jgi:PiT family inorganic phosphate transporter
VNDSVALLVIVVATAVAFDFTNGFHDTANAMATTIATRALRPKVAVALCGALNFVGAFISIKVALTISSGIVNEGVLSLQALLAALVEKVIAPAILSPIICGIAALVAHGTIAKHGDSFSVPIWVKLLSATAIAAGPYIGGWRIIRTMGHRLTEIEAPQGFVAEASGATTLLAASYFGYPLSTTHVVSGGILGVGMGKRLAEVRWGIAGQMVAAWIVTLPAAAAVGWLAAKTTDWLGGTLGAAIVVVGVAAIGAVALFALAQRRGAVTAGDV